MTPSALHAVASGAGPPLTLIHGFGLDGDTWAAQRAALAGRYRVVTLDLPGFGRSPRHVDGSVADAIARALDALGIDATHLVGLSLGGAVAVDVALAHPARVRTLTLADALLLGYPAALDTWEKSAALAKAGDCRAAVAHWLTDPVFARLRAHADTWAAVERKLRAYDCAHWVGTALIRWASTKPRPRLTEIRVPTLVLVGEHDTPAFRAMADAYAREIPGARQTVLPGAGHITPLEVPALFSRVLDEFLTTARA